MGEQTNIRTLLLQTQEEVKKAILEAFQHYDTSRLAICKDIVHKLAGLSQQFEYGKLSCEATTENLKQLRNRLEMKGG